MTARSESPHIQRMAPHYLRADAGGVNQKARERHVTYAELTEAVVPCRPKCACTLAYTPTSTVKKPAEQCCLRTVRTTHNPLILGSNPSGPSLRAKTDSKPIPPGVRKVHKQKFTSDGHRTRNPSLRRGRTIHVTTICGCQTTIMNPDGCRKVLGIIAELLADSTGTELPDTTKRNELLSGFRIYATKAFWGESPIWCNLRGRSTEMLAPRNT